MYFGPIHGGDTPSYLAIVDRILDGQFYTNINDAFRLPGYPTFVSFLLYLTHKSMTSVIIVQQLISASVAVLAYLASQQIYDSKISQLSGWLVALNPALAYFSTTILSETIVIALAVLALLFVIFGINKQKDIWFFNCGITLAVLILFNPIGALIGLSFSALLIIDRNLTQKWFKATLVMLPIFLIYFSWVGHNYTKFGYTDFVPTYGFNLLERTIYLRKPAQDNEIVNTAYEHYAQNKANETYGDQKDEMYWWNAVMDTARDFKEVKNVFEINKVFYVTAIELIKSDPIGYFRSSIGEYVYIWAGYTTHPGKWRPTEGGQRSDWSFLIFGLVLGFVMFWLVILGILNNIKHKNFLGYYLFLPIILVTIFYSLVSVTGYRYRLVIEPYIMIIISYSIINIRKGMWPLTIISDSK